MGGFLRLQFEDGAPVLVYGKTGSSNRSTAAGVASAVAGALGRRVDVVEGWDPEPVVIFCALPPWGRLVVTQPVEGWQGIS
jgi:hypothetical protein